MKLLLYGDLHAANVYNHNIKRTKFNKNEYSRIDELSSTLDWLGDTAKTENCMMSINTGDTFHQALKFYTERFNTVINGITNINNSTISKTGVIIEGNHDKSDEVSAIDIFESIKGITLVKNKGKELSILTECNAVFVFVPFIRSVETTREIFNKLYERYAKHNMNVYLFCHLEIKEAYDDKIVSKYQDDQICSYDELHLEIYKGIFSGHIHNRRDVKNNFHYIGSVLNFNFGDITQRRGATVIELGPENYTTKFIPNPFCPIFVKFIFDVQTSGFYGEENNKKLNNIKLEIQNHPFTNVYARIYSTKENKSVVEGFIEMNEHIFTAYETIEVESEEEIRQMEAVANKIESIDIFDRIVEYGSKILTSQGKAESDIEEYVARFKFLCNLN